MNEPGVDVLFVYLGIVVAVLLIPAAVMAICAAAIGPTAWTLCFRLFLIVGGAVVVGSFFVTDDHPGDQRLYRGLVFAFGISTALAAWAVDRVRARVPSARFFLLLATAAATQVAAALVALVASC